MKPQTAFKLWLILDVVSREYPYLADELSGEEWLEVSKHLMSLVPRCVHCGEFVVDATEHPCPRAEPAIIV